LRRRQFVPSRDRRLGLPAPQQRLRDRTRVELLDRAQGGVMGSSFSPSPAPAGDKRSAEGGLVPPQR